MQPFFSPIQAGSFAFGATLERLWFRRRTFHVPNLMQNYYNVFVSILTEFSPFELSSAAIKIGVWISSAGLSNLGRPQFELSSAHEKFGVWTGPNFYSQTVHWLRVNSVWNYPLRWAYLNVMKCWRSPRKVKSSSFLSARQINCPERKLSKHFPTKNPSQYPRGGEEMRDLSGLWARISRFYVRCSLMRERRFGNRGCTR